MILRTHGADLGLAHIKKNGGGFWVLSGLCPENSVGGNTCLIPSPQEANLGLAYADYYRGDFGCSVDRSLSQFTPLSFEFCPYDRA